MAADSSQWSFTLSIKSLWLGLDCQMWSAGIPVLKSLHWNKPLVFLYFNSGTYLYTASHISCFICLAFEMIRTKGSWLQCPWPAFQGRWVTPVVHLLFLPLLINSLAALGGRVTVALCFACPPAPSTHHSPVRRLHHACHRIQNLECSCLLRFLWPWFVWAMTANFTCKAFKAFDLGQMTNCIFFLLFPSIVAKTFF